MDPRRLRLLLTTLAMAAGFAGCLREPGVEERWTRMEILASSEDGSETVDLAGGEEITVSARLTYRRLLTGAFVAELRASDTLTPEMVDLATSGRQIGVAENVDYVLANSVTAGRDFRTVAGFPDLIHEVDFRFDSFVPLSENLAGPITGLFLVVYAGSEEEVRNEANEDSIVITPYVSGDYQILYPGIAIPLTTAPTP
jgi:hypothetical protein